MALNNTLITSLIRRASEAHLPADLVVATASRLDISFAALCDAFARELAEGYTREEYSWEFCDAAINSLYGSAYGDSDIGLPEFAFRVYEAFDEGEYRHFDDSGPDGPPRTRALLDRLLSS